MLYLFYQDMFLSFYKTHLLNLHNLHEEILRIFLKKLCFQKFDKNLLPKKQTIEDHLSQLEYVYYDCEFRNQEKLNS